MRTIEERARAAAEKVWKAVVVVDNSKTVAELIAAEFSDLADAERRLEAVRAYCEGKRTVPKHGARFETAIYPREILAILDGKEGT